MSRTTAAVVTSTRLCRMILRTRYSALEGGDAAISIELSVDVGAIATCPRLLRRHVTNGAKHQALFGINERFRRRSFIKRARFCQFGDAEVEYLDVVFTVQGIVLSKHHDILWLDVSMHYSLSVGGGEGAGHLHRNVQSFIQCWPLTSQVRAERYSVYELLGNEMKRAVL